MSCSSTGDGCAAARVDHPTKENTMRTILLAVLVTLGIGLVGTSGVSASPATSGVLRDLTNAGKLVEQAQYYGYGRRYRRCYRERVCDYYGRCWYERRCSYY
jgi:hypothetical protein